MMLRNFWIKGNGRRLVSLTTICLASLSMAPSGLAENPFGHFTINRGAWPQKMADAVWDRGTLKINKIAKSGSTFVWTENSSLNSGFCGTGFADMPADRKWVVWLTDLPTWLQSGTTIQTPNNWTDYENLIKWLVPQLPPQVKVIEIANERYFWGPSRAWQTASVMGEYIKRTSLAIHSINPDLIVAGPVWTDIVSYNRDRRRSGRD
jgi:hypothetical protein